MSIRKVLSSSLIGVLLSAGSIAAQDAAVREIELPERGVGAGLDHVTFYNSYFAFSDALKHARWINVAGWNEYGFPTAANPGETVRARMGVGSGEQLPAGEYTLMWMGEGSIEVTRSNSTLVSEDLSGEIKRRVYQMDPDDYGVEIEITGYPIERAKLAPPGLADHASLWNPAYVAAVEPFSDGPLRFMDMNRTNHSAQREWSDRTPYNWSSYTNNNHDNCAPWPIKGSVAYEAMIELCNEVGADMWVTVPHMATDQYVANLAHLIHTGVDRATGEQTTQPLREDLRVWIEYSNEVWNWNFGQSNWVNDNIETGSNIDERYAHRSRELFRIFEREFDGLDRLVRLVGTQTGFGNARRTRQRLGYLDRSDYDLLGVTTYFEHGIRQWIYDNPEATPEAVIDEWLRRVGTGPFQADEPNFENEKDAVEMIASREFDVPVVAYEGGDHLNPVGRIDTDGDGRKDSQLTRERDDAVEFIHSVMRHPRIKEVYKAYLDRHHASALRLHMVFVLLGNWSQYGQWGHMEYIGQPLHEAPSYEAMIEYYDLPRPKGY